VLPARVLMPRVLLMPPLLPNLEGPGRPVPRYALCFIVALLVVIVLNVVVPIIQIAASAVRIPNGVAVRRCRADGPGAILGDARAYRRGDQGEKYDDRTHDALLAFWAEEGAAASAELPLC
jgi:hypothetical protein